MTRAQQVEATRQKPHYVYIHFSDTQQSIYVGRTSEPKRRPMQAAGRDWIVTDSVDVEISPPMSFEAACWTEAHLIRSLRPRENVQHGTVAPDLDWRVNALVAAEGVSRQAARWAVKHMPTDRAEFERVMAKRAAAAERVWSEEDVAAVIAEALSGAVTAIESQHRDPLARSTRSRRSR